MTRRWAAGTAVLAAVASAIVFAADRGWRLNISPSLPVGFYRAQGVPQAASRLSLRRGTLVLVCLPRAIALFARERGYLPRGNCPGNAMPAGKVVIAVGGDIVTAGPSGVTANGALVRDSRPLVVDRHGRPLPRLAGRFVLSPDELWLGSESPLGFDSRYFGPVCVADVRAILTPRRVR